jgi:hypothetical protein
MFSALSPITDIPGPFGCLLAGQDSFVIDHNIPLAYERPLCANTGRSDTDAMHLHRKSRTPAVAACFASGIASFARCRSEIEVAG